jgi:hypothetical protein
MTNSLELTIVFYFCLGLAAGGIVNVSTIVMNEYVTTDRQNTVTTALLVFDSATMLF